MVRLALLFMAVSLGASPLAAQPADCASTPAATQTVPLALDLAGLPGVPKGAAGQVYADVPSPPPGGTVCSHTGPRRHGRILEGPPGDPLAGPPIRDVLGGR